MYYVSSTDSPPRHSIRRVPVAGGEPVDFYVGDHVSIRHLSGHDGWIYWVEDIFPDPERATVLWRASTDGGAPEILAEDLRATPGGLFFQGDFVYLADTTFGGQERLLRIPVTGGEPVLLWSSTGPSEAYVRALAGVGDCLYWIHAQSIHEMDLVTAEQRVVHSGLADPVALWAEEGRVLWAEGGRAGKIWEWDAFSDAVRLLVADVYEIGVLRRYRGNLYWTEGGDHPPDDGMWRIATAPRDGGPPVSAVAGVSRDFAPMAAAAGNLYVGEGQNLKRVPLTGGTVEFVARGLDQIVSLAADSDAVYWLGMARGNLYRLSHLDGVTTLLCMGNGSADHLRLWNDTLFWAEGADKILAAPVSGGPAREVAADTGIISDLVVDGDGVFFASGGAIRKVPHGGGAPIALARHGSNRWVRMATDDRGVYWAGPDSGIQFLDKAGGFPQMLVVNPELDPVYPSGLAVSEDRIFWAETVAGRIRLRETR